MIGQRRLWRYGNIYGGRRYSERQVRRKVRRLLSTRVFELQLRLTRYSMVSAPAGTQEASDLAVHPLTAMLYEQVAAGLTSAVDHLVGLRGLMSGRRTASAYSSYTLIRSSLEGSLGAWRLLSTPTRREAYVLAVASWRRQLDYSTAVLKDALSTEGAEQWASTQAYLGHGGEMDAEQARTKTVQWATDEARRLGWLAPGKPIPAPSSVTSNFLALQPGDPDFGKRTYNLLSAGAHGQAWASDVLAWPRDLKSEWAFFRTVDPKMPFIHRYTQMAVEWTDRSLTRAELFRVAPIDRLGDASPES